MGCVIQTRDNVKRRGTPHGPLLLQHLTDSIYTSWRVQSKSLSLIFKFNVVHLHTYYLLQVLVVLFVK